MTTLLTGKKILFANFPADGHFNPMTALAMHLKKIGCDVRWYSSRTYTHRLQKLQITHYPFQKAVDVGDNDFDKTFPGRQKHKSQIGRLKFDITHAFILRGPEYYTDILDISREFDFDLLVADCTFTGIPYIKDLMQKPVISIGVLPLIQNSRDLPPSGLGMEPSRGFWGRAKQDLLRTITSLLIFRQPNEIMKSLMETHHVQHDGLSVFDLQVKKPDLLLQSGTPGFEYGRSDLGKNIRFIGPLLPYASQQEHRQWFDERLNIYRKIVLVTQGTVEKDVSKILIPTLEAFKDSDTLVIATTGGSGTGMLKARYPGRNMIIEDFIPFADIMPCADVYITNGGYGGVMLSIQHQLPMVAAGMHEGKNEINARVNFFKFGINLKTETPTPLQIRKAVHQVLQHPEYRYHLGKIRQEFRQYHPLQLFTQAVSELLSPKKGVQMPADKFLPIHTAV